MKVEETSLEGISQVLEVLLDSLGIKKSVAGISVRKLLIDHLCSVIVGELDNKALQNVNTLDRRSKSELNKIISDIMRLRRVTINMSPIERRILFCTLLLATVSALFIYDNNAI